LSIFNFLIFYHAPLPGTLCVTIRASRALAIASNRNVCPVFFVCTPQCLLALTVIIAKAVSLASLGRSLLSAPTAIPIHFIHAKISHAHFSALPDITPGLATWAAEPVTA